MGHTSWAVLNTGFRSAALLSALCLLPIGAQANGFQNFDDAALIDQVAGAVARGYGKMHGYRVQFKMLNESTPYESALMTQYTPANRTCTFFINPKDTSWHSFEHYLQFFEGLPKKVVYEAFFAHESGHCVQFKEQIDFGPVQRAQRQELYADVFALSHVERYYPKYRPAFQMGLIKMRSVEKGTPYDFSRLLHKLLGQPDLMTALKVTGPQDRAFAIARAVDRL